jgi:hypothetical protein
MLQELVCTNLGPNDIEDVLFTIEIFEVESRTGNNYARDCHRVLQDLRSLVTRLKVPEEAAATPNGQPPVNGDANGTSINGVNGINGHAATNVVPVTQVNGTKLEAGVVDVQLVNAHVPAPIVVPQPVISAPLPPESIVMAATTATAAPVPSVSIPPVTDPAVTLQLDPRFAAVTAASCGQAAGVAFPCHASDSLYQQLVTWMDYDDLQMYNNYLI